MKIAGFPTLDVGANSTSAWGLVRMRVALVLDNTGSMAQDGKMAAMQTAAKSLVDQLSALAKTNGDVYISIVPFAKDVNVGDSNYSKYWVDFSDWDAANGSSTAQSRNSWGQCTVALDTGQPQHLDRVRGRPRPGLRHQEHDADERQCGNASSRPNSTPTATAGSSSYLQPIMPLSYDWSSLKSRIDAMKPTGNTNQGIGLAWGWMTLSTGDPMNAPAKDTNYTYKDAIVLLSDGLNTQNRWYSNASADRRAPEEAVRQRQGAASNRSRSTRCRSTPTAAIRPRSVLQYCASGTDKFYHGDDGEIRPSSVFKDIGTSLSSCAWRAETAHAATTKKPG